MDLPGLYSFTGGGQDEQVAREAIETENPDLVLNVLDSAVLVRGLMLTLQLTALRRPMVVLLNMADEARKHGVNIDTKKLSSILGVPVHLISAWTGEGINGIHRLLYAGRVPILSVPVTQESLYRKAREIGEETIECAGNGQRHSVDRLLLHPLWGLPIFALIPGLVFLIAFQWVGPFFRHGVEALMDLLVEALSDTPLNLPIIIDGLVGSIEYVLSFLPIITVLSLLLTLLEDIGYLPRVAFILDGWLRKLGLDGRCAVPLLLGLGCTVPAVLATRTLPERGLHCNTIRLLPFVPCSARLPFILMLGGILFSDHPAGGALLLYGISLLLGVIYGLFSQSREKQNTFYVELPPLRLPR